MQKILIGALLALLSGGTLAQDSALLVYKVWEQGIDPYISRILVNDDFVRLDEGEDAGDFTLFDRSQEILYNVSHDNRSVLVINPQLVEVPDNPALILAERETVDEQAPQVAGIAPRNLELLANGEVCSRLVVVPGLMEEALEGLRDLKRVLARVQAATLVGRPEELQTPCDLATNVHAATRSLDHGLPINERSEGRAQMLLDFVEAQPADNSLFELPTEYDRASMPSL